MLFFLFETERKRKKTLNLIQFFQFFKISNLSSQNFEFWNHVWLFSIKFNYRNVEIEIERNKLWRFTLLLLLLYNSNSDFFLLFLFLHVKNLFFSNYHMKIAIVDIIIIVERNEKKMKITPNIKHTHTHT